MVCLDASLKRSASSSLHLSAQVSIKRVQGCFTANKSKSHFLTRMTRTKIMFKMQRCIIFIMMSAIDKAGETDGETKDDEIMEIKAEKK